MEIVEIETETLVRKAKKGNRKALELLLKENYQQMYKTALIYVKNEQDALDVVQETAYKVTMKLDTLKENQYFKTWLIKILIRCAYDVLDKKKPVEDLNQVSQTKFSSESENPNQQQIEHLTLFEAIEKLPLNYQNVVILFYFQDFSIKEIATIVMYPEGTVKYNLHEARKTLKKLLGGAK